MRKSNRTDEIEMRLKSLQESFERIVNGFEVAVEAAVLVEAKQIARFLRVGAAHHQRLLHFERNARQRKRAEHVGESNRVGQRRPPGQQQNRLLAGRGVHGKPFDRLGAGPSQLSLSNNGGREVGD